MQLQTDFTEQQLMTGTQFDIYRYFVSTLEERGIASQPNSDTAAGDVGMSPHSTNKRVALVVGGSRGIGRQICLDLAKDGYTVAIAGKTVSDASTASPYPPDPNSPQSTINTVAREVEDAGGEALPVQVDTRDYENVVDMIERVIKRYGHIDALIYNSGAVWWSSVEKTPMKRFQLMQRVNPEGLYGTIQACLPHFKAAGWNARIIVVSPPIYSRFFRGKTAYAIGKVGMSVLTKGLAMDFEREGRTNMAITSIWPAAAIESGATQSIPTEVRAELRRPTIFSAAILAMLKAAPEVVNGCLELDEDFLRDKCGVVDFEEHNLVEGGKVRRIMPKAFPDLRVEEQDDEGRRHDSTVEREKKAKL